MKNWTAYMTEKDHMELREEEMPVPGPEEVLIRMEYVGICGSDIHYFHDGRCGDFVVDGEFILGHEGAGTIVEVGKKVTSLKKGDRVAIEPGITCGQCEFCKSGRYNLCPDVRFLATPPVAGCFQQYLAFPASLCFRLPEGISCKEGALIEPLSVGMNAALEAEVGMGDTVLILGTGCIGLMTLLSCKACGAGTMIAVDTSLKRLEFAKSLGASYVIQAGACNVIEEVERLTGGEGAPIVLETAGSAVTLAQTPYLVKRGGRIVLVGMAANPKVEYDFGKIMAKEATIRSIFRYKNTYPKAIALLEQGRIRLDGIVTHEFALKEIQQAFEAAIYEKDAVVKAVISLEETEERVLCSGRCKQQQDPRAYCEAYGDHPWCQNCGVKLSKGEPSRFVRADVQR